MGFSFQQVGQKALASWYGIFNVPFVGCPPCAVSQAAMSRLYSTEKRFPVFFPSMIVAWWKLNVEPL
jgi:hypothetical protein